MVTNKPFSITEAFSNIYKFQGFIGFTLVEVFSAMSGGNRKTAYTLAEVLITLGIIGVVAAMTLPAIIQDKQNKELHTALLKNYSVIQQVIDRMTLDRGERPKSSNFEYLEFAPVFLEYFNKTVKCSEGKDGCASKVEDENDSSNTTMIKEYLTFNKSRNVSTTYFDDGKFRTLNEYYMFENQNPNLLIITVDVNGIKKKPNIWGHDLFSFQLLTTGKLIPAGTPNTNFASKDTYCSNKSSDKLNGIGCTYYALTDKDYWKNLP